MIITGMPPENFGDIPIFDTDQKSTETPGAVYRCGGKCA